jgi:hypothetical protein
MTGDLDRLLERGESLCGEHRKVWPECASLHPEVSGDLPEGQQSKGPTEALPHTPLNKSLRDLIADEFAEFMHQEGAAQRPNDFADRVMSLLGGLAGESVCTGRVCLLDEQPWNRWR